MAKIPKGQRCEAILGLASDRSTMFVRDLPRCPEPATEIVPDPFLEQVYLCKGHKEEFSREAKEKSLD